MSTSKRRLKATKKRLAGHPWDEPRGGEMASEPPAVEEAASEESPGGEVASVQVSVKPESPASGEKLSKLVAALDKATVENDALNQAVTEGLWPSLHPLPRHVQKWCEAAVALAMGDRDPSTVEIWQDAYQDMVRRLLPPASWPEVDGEVASLVRAASDDDHEALRASTDALLKLMGELSFAISDAQTNTPPDGQVDEGKQAAEPGLDEVDLAILKVLAKYHHALPFTDIASELPPGNRRNRNTVSRRCKKLHGKGLVSLLHRRGAQITPAGRSIVGQA